MAACLKNPRWRLAGLITLLFILPSCSEVELGSHLAKVWRDDRGTQTAQQGTFKVGKPYRGAEGEWYTPEETYSYSETGIASWYGSEFQGKRTASGETFDRNELTAAHRTLQMPSLVKVTNLDNGRSLVVRVNDRGPFARGRVMDVSEHAAKLLGFYGIGTAKVRLDLLSNESRTIAEAAKRGENTAGYEVAMNDGRALPAPPANAPLFPQPVEQTASPAPLTSPGYQTASIQSQPLATPEIPGHVKNGAFLPDPVVGHEAVHPTSIYVQAGSFSHVENAQSLATKLGGLGNAKVYPTTVQGKQFFRVRIGPIPDVPHADALLSRLIKAGDKQAITVVD